MSAPTPVVRAVVYERDDHRCVCCGAMSPLEFQHRNNALRRERPTYQEGLAACPTCNQFFTHRLQQQAWRYGWAVRRWVSKEATAELPVFYQWAGVWCLLTGEGERVRIGRADAERRMLAVYGDEWLGWTA